MTWGSSPLARGPRQFSHILLDSGGLIPARAGTTLQSREDVVSCWAHPRSRGDHTC